MKKFTVLMLLVAMNLRLSVTALTPLFPLIQRELQVTPSLMALLVTIPLACFGLGSIMVPHLLQRLGMKTMLVMTTSLLLAANLIRPLNSFTLLAGTFLVGLAIAGLNVTVPSMITTITTIAPTDPTRLTSYYALIMNIVAASGTALAIPLATCIGWQTVLSLFALPALIALCSIPILYPKKATVTATVAQPKVSLITSLKYDRIALKLALFMGLQSLIFYTLATWLPTIYRAAGATSTEAGLLLAVFQFIGVPAALLLNVFHSQRQMLRWLLAGYLLGLSLLAWHGLGWWLAAIVLGFTAALMFSFALNLIATSSHDAATITNRAAIAQSLGYLLAAIGPLMLGQLQQLTHSWLSPLLVLAGLVGLTIWMGFRLTTTR